MVNEIDIPLVSAIPAHQVRRGRWRTQPHAGMADTTKARGPGPR